MYRKHRLKGKRKAKWTAVERGDHNAIPVQENMALIKPTYIKIPAFILVIKMLVLLPSYRLSRMRVRLMIRRLRVLPPPGRHYSVVEIDHEISSTAILSLPLIQEGQLSVSGERMCTILVDRLED